MNSTVFLLYFLNDFDFKAFDLYPSLSKTNILHIFVIELQPFHLWKLTMVNFHKWKGCNSITKMCKILVFDRDGYKSKALKSKSFKKYNKKTVEFIKFNKVNISSSQLRKI